MGHPILLIFVMLILSSNCELESTEGEDQSSKKEHYVRLNRCLEL